MPKLTVGGMAIGMERGSGCGVEGEGGGGLY